MVKDEKSRRCFLQWENSYPWCKRLGATAIGIKNGRIPAVGSNEEIRQISGSLTRLIDLKGKRCYRVNRPAYSHWYMFAECSIWGDGRCPPNKSVVEVLDRIRERVRETPKGKWIIVRLSMFGDQKLVEKRFPTKRRIRLGGSGTPGRFTMQRHAQIAHLHLWRQRYHKRKPQILQERLSNGMRKQGKPTGIFKEMMDSCPTLPTPINR